MAARAAAAAAAAVPVARFKQRPLLGRYTTLPVELFRINSSDKITLRDYDSQTRKGRSSYDCQLGEDGLVHPMEGDMFYRPNGASMRPNGTFLQEIVHTFKGKKACLYRIPAGTPLPPRLVCLHEHSDHHSLQCSEPMSLSELNKLLTKFCKEKGEFMTKDDFIRRYEI